MFSPRRFGMDTKKLSLTNHCYMIENFFIDSYLRETKPDCLLYAEDGSKLKIHKVRVLNLLYQKSNVSLNTSTLRV